MEERPRSIRVRVARVVIGFRSKESPGKVDEALRELAQLHEEYPWVGLERIIEKLTDVAENVPFVRRHRR